MRTCRVLSLLFLLLSPSATLAGVKGETPGPTPEGERIRHDTEANGLSYIAFVGTDHLEIAQGGVEIGAKTVRFKNRLGQLFSVRLDLVDMPTTQRIRDLIGQARWLDEETAVMSRVRVQPSKPQTLDASTEEQDTKRNTSLRADCSGPSGSTLAPCSPASRGQPWRTPKKARPRPRRSRPGRNAV